MVRTLALVMTLGTFLVAGTTQAGVPGDALCKEKKAKAAGKKAADLMKAFGKNIKKPDAVKLAESVSKAQSKFTKGFTKAEAKGECDTSGDAAAIEAKVDAAVSDLVLKLTNICGDNSRAGGEQCDGTDASECQGLCLPNCTCPEPICNNGVKELGEECDPAGSTVDCTTGEICGGFCECVPDVACNCGTPDPSLYMFTGKAPVQPSCGTTDGSPPIDSLQCGGLYIGGGSGALPVPNLVPDEYVSKWNVTQCKGTDLTLAHTTQAQVGARQCTEGKKCVGGSNDGQPCIRNRECEPGGSCKVRCFFGSPISVLDLGLPALSTCCINEIAEDSSGGADCATGESLIRYPMDTTLYLTLADQSPSTPGYSPCPICVGGTLNVPDSGTCEGGPNNGLACMPQGTPYDVHDCCAGGGNNSRPCSDDSDCPGSTCISGCSIYPTSHDCPPNPLGKLGGILFTLGLTADTSAKTADADGNFCGWCRDVDVEGTKCFEGDEDKGPPPGTKNCPDSTVIACRPTTYHGPGGGDPADIAECGDPLPCRTDADCAAPYETCEQRNPGAWRDATTRNITYTGTRPGDLSDHLPHPGTVASAFCIPPTSNSAIDNQADLGGPGGLSLEVEMELYPSGAFIDMTPE